MYSLLRESDFAGDCGGLSQAIDPKTLKSISDRPVLGCCMQVGSLYARTMYPQDWWCTTPIIEIIEESENLVRFRTINSVYTWEKRIE
jgi:hypothetical protein